MLPWGVGCRSVFSLWYGGVVGCVFAGVGAGGVGDVFWWCCCRVVFEGDIHLILRVAYLVFSVVQCLYEVERKCSNPLPPTERENVMAISATLEARSTTILNNLDSLATAPTADTSVPNRQVMSVGVQLKGFMGVLGAGE